MFTLNGKVISIDAPITHDGIQYPNLRDPEVRALIGVVEVPDQVRPQPEEHYFITTDENGFEVYTEKNPEQIKEIENSKILQQIDALERKEMLPRGAREILIESMQDKAIRLGAAAADNFTLAQFNQVVAVLGMTLDANQTAAVASGNVPPFTPAQSLEVAYAFNIAYRNYVDFDNMIAGLRSQLIK